MIISRDYYLNSLKNRGYLVDVGAVSISEKNENGIVIISLKEFLLNENSLDI